MASSSDRCPGRGSGAGGRFAAAASSVWARAGPKGSSACPSGVDPGCAAAVVVAASCARGASATGAWVGSGGADTCAKGGGVGAGMGADIADGAVAAAGAGASSGASGGAWGGASSGAFTAGDKAADDGAGTAATGAAGGATAGGRGSSAGGGDVVGGAGAGAVSRARRPSLGFVLAGPPGAAVVAGSGFQGRPVSRSSSARLALKTSEQRPQRTQPPDTLSWSRTTRNTVWQAGQRVASPELTLLSPGCSAGQAGMSPARRGRCAHIRTQPSSSSVTLACRWPA
jgi:hypothetical protein